MYPGWLSTGQGNPYEGGTWVELINNNRAYAYAAASGLCWLEECSTCPETETVTPGGQDFVSPVIDPAPWYDENDPDSWGFLGVVGVDISGSENSTRQATVMNSITGGGVIGPAYYGPRTLVVRALVIAEDECSLQFGLNYLRDATGQVDNACEGDSLTFFDCCPCVCDADTPGGPCWVDVYRELREGPDACDPDWWPSTYRQLRLGPPASSEDWCIWIDRYWQLKNLGPTEWPCCVSACVLPYLRQYHNTMVIEGPVVLNHPTMHTNGAMAEVEFTIVAADPTEYALSGQVASASLSGASLLSAPLASLSAGVNTMDTDPPDPFQSDHERSRAFTALRTKPRLAEPENGWVRDEVIATQSVEGPVLSGQRMSFKLRAFDSQIERTRIGVWDGETRVAGYTVPFVPVGSYLIIDGARQVVEGYFDVRSRRLSSFVKDWDGGPAKFPTLPYGEYRITVDQEVGRQTVLDLIVAATPAGAR